MLGYGFKFAYTSYVNVEQFNKKTSIVSIGTLIAAGFNIVTNMIFIPIFGFEAAAYTTLAGFVVLLLIHYFISRKLGFTVVYDNRFIFIVLAIMTVLGLMLQVLYPFMIVRWVLAFAVGVGALIGIYRVWNRYFR